MKKFTVVTKQVIEAKTPEEAAMLMYQDLNNTPAPLMFSVTAEDGATTNVKLDRKAVEVFTNEDHTADP